MVLPPLPGSQPAELAVLAEALVLFEDDAPTRAVLAAEVARGPAVAVTVDTGACPEERAGELAARAAALGAGRHVHIDARAEVWDALRPLLAAGLLAGAGAGLFLDVERLVQARRLAGLVRDAARRGPVRAAVPRGDLYPGLGAALRGLEVACAVHEPAAEPLARRESAWGAAAAGVELPPPSEPFDPSVLPGDDPFETVAIFEELTVELERGVPVAVSGTELDPETLVARLASAGKRHGVGRLERPLGDRRLAFAAPGLTLAAAAHDALAQRLLSPEQQRLREQVRAVYQRLLQGGALEDPAARDIEGLLEAQGRRVSGAVTLRLFCGGLHVVSVAAAG